MRPMLASTWEGQDPTGWLMTEKHNGFRGIWDNGVMYSREGNDLHAPAWMAASIPNFLWPIDGEVYAPGRIDSLSWVKRQIGRGWKGLVFVAFDLQIREINAVSRRIRLDAITSLTSENFQIAPSRECEGFDDFFREFAQINYRRGEGIVIRNPYAFYKPSTSNSDYSKDMLKLRCLDRPDLLPIKQEIIDRLLKS